MGWRHPVLTADCSASLRRPAPTAPFASCSSCPSASLDTQEETGFVLTTQTPSPSLRVFRARLDGAWNSPQWEVSMPSMRCALRSFQTNPFWDSGILHRSNTASLGRKSLWNDRNLPAAAASLQMHVNQCHKISPTKGEHPPQFRGSSPGASLLGQPFLGHCPHSKVMENPLGV